MKEMSRPIDNEYLSAVIRKELDHLMNLEQHADHIDRVRLCEELKLIEVHLQRLRSSLK